MPERVFFEPSSLKYELGQKLWEYFNEKNDVTVAKTSLQRVSSLIPGNTEREKYARAKNTLVVATKKGMKFDVCKPSADFQFSLATNCPANCEYCYLQTTQAYKPYLRTYVNLEDIFKSIERHVKMNNNQLTQFEVASMGDPLALEHITGSLGKTIEFIGQLENAKLRVVSKFDNITPLLGLNHNNKTKFRFSINSKYVIENFEHNTSTIDQRIKAASQLLNEGYPIGFIVAPIMIYEDWEEEYRATFEKLSNKLNFSKLTEPITFELIQHRFTAVAKEAILSRCPETKLDMNEEKRMLKWGKFGRFKYVYSKELSTEIKTRISEIIKELFPDSQIEYFT